MTLNYKLIDTNRICPGIHKVRARPATRSAGMYTEKKIVKFIITSIFVTCVATRLCIVLHL